MYRGFSSISLHKLFISWIQTVKVLGVIHANWLRPGALGILLNIFFQARPLIGGICWTSRRWMHPVSIHSSLDCAISGTTGWAFSWTSPLSPRPCWLHRLPVRLHKVNHKVKISETAQDRGIVTMERTLIGTRMRSIEWRYFSDIGWLMTTPNHSIFVTSRQYVNG